VRSSFLFFLLAALAPAETLIDTNFSGDYQTVKSGSRVSGALPHGWRDNSNFGRTWVNYVKLQEAQRTFLRVDVTRFEDGWCQFLAPLPRFTQETYLRLNVTMRSPDGLLTKIGVRRLAAPYHFLWEENKTFTSEWKDYTFYGHVGKTDFDTGFFIVAEGAGRLDIAKFSLEKITLEELKRQLGEPKPAESKNLVRISRFPLGLQSGWSLSREASDEDEVKIAADREVTGPSGSPAMRITASKNMQLYSAPFAIAGPLEQHVASLYLRGKASGRLTVVSGLQPLGLQKFELNGDSWQRVAVRFKPDLLGRAHGLRIEGIGDFWIDGMQVERGTEATAYASAGPCEVSLATDSPLRIQFDDEADAVRYAVSGEAKDAVLHARVVNVYGDQHDLPAITLHGGFLNQGTVKYNVFPMKPYGSFRIEAWVTDAKGKLISPYNELVVNRLHRPRYWMKDAPNSPFGTHTLSTTRHILMAKAAGVNWTRFHDAGTAYTGWYHLERKPGEWTFRDQDIQRYRKLGMKIMGAFSTAPEWASYFTSPHEQYGDRYFEPRDMNAWANYVRVLTARYKGVIDTYDVWNEPWGSHFWNAGYDEARQRYVQSADPAGDFVKLMKTAYTAAKSVDPKVTVLGVQTTVGPEGTKWTKEIADGGGLQYCDVLCYHQYTPDAPGYPGDTTEMGLRSALGPFLDQDGHPVKPAWMSEGCSVDGRTGSGLYRYTLPYENEEDVMETSDRLCRFVVGLLARGVERIFLYSMHSHNWFGTQSLYRVLVTDEGYLHPSGAAHSAMAWFLEDTRVVKSYAPAEGVLAFVFQGAGRTVTVLSPRPRHAPYAVPAGAYDLFGNPITKGEALGKTLVYVVQ
jgi:hypothetical protein